MKILFSVALSFLSCYAFAQSNLYAVGSGAPSAGSFIWDADVTSLNDIWSTNRNAVSGTVGLRPTAADNVFTNGKDITVSVQNVSCKNLYITYNNASGLTITGLRTVTINGTMTGWIDNSLAEEYPNTSVLVFNSASARLIFTGLNVDPGYSPNVIYGWDSSVPIGRTVFNLSSSRSLLEALTFSSSVQVQGGTLTLAPSTGISGNGSTSSLTVDLGATLAAGSNVISGFPAIDISGTLTSSNAISNISNLTVSGSINTSGSISSTDATISGTVTTSSFFNALQNLTITGTLNTSYSGGTQGWWSGSNSPSGTFSLSNASTVNYSSASNQPVFATAYGHLIISGAGTKTVSNTANLSVNNLTISGPFVSNGATGVTISGNLNNSGSWSPTDLVLFTGSTAAQSIGGTATTTFSGGLELNSGFALNLSRPIVATGINVTAGTLNLGSQSVSLSGNLDNDATIIAGSSTVQVTGNSSITGTVPFTLNNVTVSAGQTFSPNAGFTVAGTFTNNGILNLPSGTVNFNGNYINNSASPNSVVSNNGTVVFGGGSPQTISGSAANAFNNITINNATLNQGTINLGGAFTLGTSATFNASSGSGVFNILSTSLTSSGRIAAFTGSTSNFSGTVTIQRYIDAKEDYRFLSYPILNGNVSGWQDDFPVTGFSGESCTPDGTIIVDCSAPSIFSYNGATQQYTAVSGTTYAGTPLSSRVGYTAFSYGVFSGRTIDMTGNIEAGEVVISNLGTGYNLVPNPYPSPIDWDNVDRTNTNNTVYMTTAQGSSASYVAGQNVCTGCGFNLNWRGEVAIGQSYWINRTSAGTMTYQEDDKTGSATFVREDNAIDYFRVVLESNGQKDDAVVSFKQGTNGDYDFGLDAPKRKNGFYDSNTGRYSYINLSTFLSDANQDMAINTISPIQCNGNIKLKVQDLTPGTHSLKITDLANLSLGYKLALKDNFKGNQTPVEGEFEYQFEITSDLASAAENRFEILLSSPQVEENRNLGISSELTCNVSSIKVNLSNLQTGVKYLFKLNDQPLHTAYSATTSTGEVMIPKASLTYGQNNLMLVASSFDGCNAKVINNALTIDFAEIKEISSVTSTSVCGSGSATITADGAPAGGSYKWYESLNAVEPIASANGSVFTTPNLTSSATYYVSAVNANGCESLIRKPVEAKVIGVTVPEVNVIGNVLSVTPANNETIQWFKDGVLIPNATSDTFEVKETGSYSVQFSTRGCQSSSTPVDFLISGVEENPKGLKFNVYPNPVSDLLKIGGPVDQIDGVRMYSTNGAKAEFSRVDDVKGQMVLDIKNLRKGFYFLNISTGKNIVLFKVLKK